MLAIRNPLRFLLPLLIVASLAACSRPPEGAGTPKLPPSSAPNAALATATSLPPTPTVAAPTPIPTTAPTSAPTARPTNAAAPTSTAIPTSTPTPRPAVARIPNGLAVLSPNRRDLTLYNLRGQISTRLTLPGAGTIVHIGSWTEGTQSVPLIYLDNELRTLQLLQDKTALTLVPARDWYAGIGAPGQPVLAYNRLDYQDNGVVSRLYLGAVASLGTLSPTLVVSSTESQVIQPLAVRAEGGQPVGAWYAMAPYGIGGDIVFPMHQGLYYLDAATGSSREVLGTSARAVSLSPDYSWAAYTTNITRALTLHNLTTALTLTIPLRPDSDRGAGYAVFAPDNQSVAWMEAGGQLWADPPTFRATVRIATTDGRLLTEIPAATLAGATGFPAGADLWTVPVGWLDGETLIVHATAGKSQTAILRVDARSGTASRLALGAPVGFLYP